MSRFALEDVVSGGRHLLVVRGELDADAARSLEGCLDEVCSTGAAAVLLDLSQLAFMDTTGLRAVLFARDVCQKHGCEFGLVQGPPQIRRLFEVAGLLDMPFQDEQPVR
ncbi:MAG TPA: STAS domain-containing protein [Solirubrobacteraceae bacterium]|nr:STAS domain-containing protein [Solirubrobacteraceae bacterium]